MDVRDAIIEAKIVENGKSFCGKLRNPVNLPVKNAIETEFRSMTGRDPVVISEAIFCFYHGTKPHLCLCGQETKYIDFKNGYRNSCSSRCAALNPQSQLVRFCSDEQIHSGMFSKMLKYAISVKNYKKIVSFADRRYSTGNLYLKNNFVETKIIPPDYRYIKNLKTFHKSTFRKKQIQKKFGLDMSVMTENDAMCRLGYKRIYDCGKIKYEWNESL